MILVPRKYQNLQHCSDDHSETRMMENKKNVMNLEYVLGARIALMREKTFST